MPNDRQLTSCGYSTKAVSRHRHVVPRLVREHAIGLLLLWTLAVCACGTSPVSACDVKPLTDEQAQEYKLDASFYKKYTVVQGILVATSQCVSDDAHREAAYQFDMIMKRIDPAVAGRVRDRKVLCLLIAHDEMTSDLPPFATDKTGEELDYYNWRNRGFLSWKDGRPMVVFAEEDVLEFARNRPRTLKGFRLAGDAVNWRCFNGVVSIPHVTLVVFHPVTVQELAIFLLENFRVLDAPPSCRSISTRISGSRRKGSRFFVE